MSVPSDIASTLVTAWAPQLAPVVVFVESVLVSFLANPTTATVAASVLAVLVSLMFLPAIPIGFTARDLCYRWADLFHYRVLGSSQTANHFSPGSIVTLCPHGVVPIGAFISVPYFREKYAGSQLTGDPFVV